MNNSNLDLVFFFRKRKVLAEKSIEEDSRNVSEPSFKEFDSEIVDCVVQDDGIQVRIVLMLSPGVAHLCII